MQVFEPKTDFDFGSLFLGTPYTILGGAFFTKIFHKNNQPLFIQIPKCVTKQGFVKNKKMYCDLVYDNNDEMFINWLEKLENKCQELIFEKKDIWFENKLNREDIENSFTSPVKIYKSGKFFLLRTNIKNQIKIYDENDNIISSEDISNEDSIITILEVQGIKFTSRNFQIEFEMKQCLKVSPDPFSSCCFIKNPNKIKVENLPLVRGPVPDEKLKGFGDLSLTETSLASCPQEGTLSELVCDDFNLEEILDNFENLKPQMEKSLLQDIPKEEEKNLLQDIPKKDYGNLRIKFIEDSIHDLDSENNVDSIKILNENINIDVEDLNEDNIKEVELNLSSINEDDTIQLKGSTNMPTKGVREPVPVKQDASEVYYDMYKKAKKYAKEQKKKSLIAYLEAKNIKKTYMLNDSDSDDSDSNEIDNST